MAYRVPRYGADRYGPGRALLSGVEGGGVGGGSGRAFRGARALELGLPLRPWVRVAAEEGAQRRPDRP